MGREKKIFFSLCENFLINSGFDFLFQFVTGDSVITNYTELWGKTCNLNKKNSKKKDLSVFSHSIRHRQTSLVSLSASKS